MCFHGDIVNTENFLFDFKRVSNINECWKEEFDFMATLGIYKRINLPAVEPSFVHAVIITIVCVNAGLDHLFHN